MNTFLVLVGVFLGGATPWLEVVLVVPAGILAGVHPVPVVLAGLAGNLLTVGMAAMFGQRIRAWWERRRPDSGRSRSERGTRLLTRYGLPSFALFGPVVVGTQLSALLAVCVGIDRKAVFVWVAGATTVWAVVAAALTVTGVSLFG